MKTEDIKVQIIEGRIYITVPDSMEHMGFVISSADGQLRKGVEVGICPKCKAFENLSCSCEGVDYCLACEVEESGFKCEACDGTGIRTVEKKEGSDV